jgi:exosortase
MSRTPVRDIPAATLLFAVTTLLLAPAIGHAVELWSTTEEFSYGFLIVPIAAGLVFMRRDRLRALAGAGDDRGLILAGGGLLLYLLGERMNVHALSGLAVTPVLLGSALYLWGRGVAVTLAFPLCFLAFGFAPYRGLLDTLGFSLQVATADGAALVASSVGLPVVLEGLVLRLPSYAFVVAEACSGMSSLLSMLALASVFIYLADASLRRKLAVIGAVLPIVVVANVLRVTLVLVVALWLGPETATGFFHGASSLVLFAFALAGLFGFSRVVGCRIPVVS